MRVIHEVRHRSGAGRLVRPLVCVAGLLLTGCATKPLPVDQPCGVIRDSLVGVAAKSVDGQRRLDIHHARGRAAGCW